MDFIDITPDRLKDLDKSEIEKLTEMLEDLMPKNTIVTDMWNWDEHVERTVFEDSFFDVALGSEEDALYYAKPLQDEVLRCIDEYKLDYDQSGFEDISFEDFVYEQCCEFIKGWRKNIEEKFAAQK